MPIKYLDSCLEEGNLVKTLPLSLLSESRLGIDASHYLRLLLESPETREPQLAATGGLPLALTAKIESDLRALEKLHIKPVFVFPGLLPANKTRPNPQAHNDACQDRKNAWNCYESGNTEAANKLFATRSNVSQWDLWRSVLRIFKQRNVDFVVAPYLAWAQLIYLQKHHKNYIHSIFGPTDALLYPTSPLEKLITSLDLSATTPTFTYVVKSEIIRSLNTTEDQFCDAGILAGFDHSQTFPFNPEIQDFKVLVDMVRKSRTGFNFVAQHGNHGSPSPVEHFARTRSMIRFSIILATDGAVLPLPLAIPGSVTAAEIPRDLDEVFTHHLPEEVYFYLSRGLIGPQALIWLTSGQIIENPPLDNGDTGEYKRFIREVLTEGSPGPRTTALALISHVLAEFWQKKKVQPWFWFDQPQPHTSRAVSHNAPPTVELVKRIGGWRVPALVVEEELRRQQSSTIDFALCLGATSSEKLAHRTRPRTTPQTTPHHLDKKDEVVANVIWRFLELRGFLVHTHIHSPLGRAMSAALKVCKVNDKFQDPLFLFLELMRGGVMHGKLWSNRAYSGGPSFGTDDEKRSMLLIMRVLSIVPLQFKPEPWAGPLSRELLVFNGFVRALSRSLRTLIELTALNMLLSRHARRGREDLLDISLSLPFQADVNTGFGILAKVYLDATVMMYNEGRTPASIQDANAEGVAEAKQDALGVVEDTFTGVKNPRAEVERGFRFWDAALAAVRSLAKDQQMSEVIGQFDAADAWLRPMRP